MNSSREEGRDFVKKIRENHAFLVLAAAQTLHSPWMHFIAGYCLGNDRQLYLYLPRRDEPLPAYLEFANTGDSADAVRSFFKDLKKMWQRKLTVEHAKKKLAQQGLPFTVHHYFQSIRENNAEAAALFIKAGIPPDTKDEKGATGLCQAVRHHHNNTALVFIDARCDINLVCQDNGNNALMDAAAANNEKMLELLIKKGSELDRQSKSDQTALMMAVGRGNEKSVRLLIAAGARTDLMDILGMSARHYAHILKHRRIANLLPAG
jgi:hypothetical protein